MRIVVVMVAMLATTTIGGVARAESSAERRLQALEEMIQKQAAEIQNLRRELQEQKTSARLTQQKAERADEKATAIETVQKTLPKWLEKMTLFGDIRVRHEGFYNQPHGDGETVHARNRERFRARVGLTFKYSDELQATIRLATGNPNDPISTNVTFGNAFSRKDINLDWAYMTLTPGETFGWRPGIASITAGKFPNPMFRVSEMVFDEDLSLEGFSETFNVLAKSHGNLDQVRVHVQQWNFAEFASQQDGWMFGGQINPVGHAGAVQLEGGVGQYYWLNPNEIAQQLNTNSVLINTNQVIEDSDGDVVAYRSAFNQTNLNMAVTVPDVVGTMPLRFFGEYVYNWQGVGDDVHGLLGGVKLGQPKKRGDWAVMALYEYLGQEAAISAFTWSDFGNAGTNQEGPVFAVDYQLLDPLTLTARTYITNFVQRPSLVHNDTQVRLQLDAQIRF